MDVGKALEMHTKMAKASSGHVDRVLARFTKGQITPRGAVDALIDIYVALDRRRYKVRDGLGVSFSSPIYALIEGMMTKADLAIAYVQDQTI